MSRNAHALVARTLLVWIFGSQWRDVSEALALLWQIYLVGR